MEAKIVIAPMQWRRLQDITEIKPLCEDDSTVLAEIRDVLRRHGATERFGVTLLHKHFELAEEEYLLEQTDVASRTLTLQPVDGCDKTQTIATCWKFEATGGTAEPIAKCKCPWDPLEHRHSGRHE
jgi:hypothetical protein